MHSCVTINARQKPARRALRDPPGELVIEPCIDLSACDAQAGDGAPDYRAFMPAAQNDRADIREIEPYVHCQSTHAPASLKAGRSRVPWLSGTASWAHFTATNYILGIRPEDEGLRIDPCIPSTWPGFTATRRFRGKTIHIEVRNPHGKNRGVASLVVDGRTLGTALVSAELLTDGAHLVVTL